ncbi:MAG: hypothetical protein C4530_05790 [Desulfobacteraceae bacterium]|nr:MAG: hypothetical protein C4530_05790 [Desulfobacteraceae bacterium]
MIFPATTVLKALMMIWMSFSAAACSAGTPVPAGSILENEKIREASGLAASRLRSERIWILNDGGNGPVLYAASIDGKDLGSVTILKARNRDWEALTAFEYRGKSYLAIGDIGDNDSRRKTCSIYIIEEPETVSVSGSGCKPVRHIDFKFEDGPRDCEAMAVDTENRRILLLTKQKEPALYWLPLFPEPGARVVVARRAGRRIDLKGAGGKIDDKGGFSLLDLFRYQPTGMDLSPDGRWLAVLTYHLVYLFPFDPEDFGGDTFRHTPRVFDFPRLPQAECIGFSADGRMLFISSEKRPARLLAIDFSNGKDIEH